MDPPTRITRGLHTPFGQDHHRKRYAGTRSATLATTMKHISLTVALMLDAASHGTTLAVGTTQEWFPRRTVSRR